LRPAIDPGLGDRKIAKEKAFSIQQERPKKSSQGPTKRLAASLNKIPHQHKNHQERWARPH